ncbi:MAG: hypothetical protein A2161_06880 [Candidatus Schekmanbacteria bacterium RBG_13_48_7]|uniref:Endoglucanase n=1 Tax=Candidatus Schekmanbacteria bacterium RBG_13_48_7 TaxID=1817878 RepID=A0A1F7RLN4_9BACT|nr:MAG: hypothetical protein A2161_06880 [Candidatus Schekmanbacteria bacterium RBG_13_48_7]
MKKTKNILEKLVKLPGIPGREEAVVEFLMNYPLDTVNKEVDISGNTWIECRGGNKPPLILSAHMDEVGCRVKKIEDDGRISVIGLERTDLRTLAGQIMQIHSRKNVYEAFVYMNQKTTLPKNYSDMTLDNLRLDLGFMSRAETEKTGILPNDPVTYSTEFIELQKDIICAKAFDNRSSLAAILRALEFSTGKRKQRPVLLGTVQEEIGGQGALALEFKEQPGAVMIIDICGAEVFDLSESERRTIMGKGPILLNHPGTNRGLYQRLIALAEENNIPYQLVGMYGRGADASILQQKCGGLPTMTVIIPMAYYHAPKGLINIHDVFNTARLLETVLKDDSFLDAGLHFS